MTTTEIPTRATAVDLPFDLYREVHKGLRRALFDLTVHVGAADCADVDQRTAVVHRTRNLVANLHHHHTHEDLFIQPAIVAVDPALAAIVDDGHIETEDGIAAIEADVDRLERSVGGEAVAVGLDLYRRLALFTAQYLAHMALEEGGVMDALRTAMSDDELLALEMELRASVAPPTMCGFITIMLPAMTPAERVAMLGGMHAGAPAEIFEQFRAAAEAALGADDYRTLAAGIGIA